VCVLPPSVGLAGPIGDSLRAVSARQAASAPKSRQDVWAGGIVLTVVGGILIIVGESQTRDNPDFGRGCESAGLFGCSPRLSDPNNALIGAGAAAAGAGVIMIVLGRTGPRRKSSRLPASSPFNIPSDSNDREPIVTCSQKGISRSKAIAQG